MRILQARREDFGDFARLFPELRTGDSLPALEPWAAHVAPDILFLERDGARVAYAWAQAPSRTGYLRHVVVDPAARGQGLGRVMMLAAAARMRACGCERWELNVKRDNAPAIALYLSLGMTPQYDTWVVRVEPRCAERFEAPGPDLRVRECSAESDERLARRFQLSPGVLAFHRAKPDCRVFVVERSDELEGLAPYDPSYPGCFPFRATDPSVARVAILALVPHLPPDKTELQLVIERDEPVARALLAAGATLRFEIVHMEGALPPDSEPNR